MPSGVMGKTAALSIVDRIVRGFNGYIKVESQPNQGTCFTVYLPAHHGDSLAA